MFNSDSRDQWGMLFNVLVPAHTQFVQSNVIECGDFLVTSARYQPLLICFVNRKWMLNRNWFGCATLSQQRWKTCQWESLKNLHVTTSSSTNIPTKATTCSPQVKRFWEWESHHTVLFYSNLIPSVSAPPNLFFCPFAVFIYSMPGYNCSIRERMLYSSCKNPLVDMVENTLQIEIEKKVRKSSGCNSTPYKSVLLADF